MRFCSFYSGTLRLCSFCIGTLRHNQPLLWTGPRRGDTLFYSSARFARRVAGHIYEQALVKGTSGNFWRGVSKHLFGIIQSVALRLPGRAI